MDGGQTVRTSLRDYPAHPECERNTGLATSRRKMNASAQANKVHSLFNAPFRSDPGHALASELPCLVIENRLANLVRCIHHERPMLHDGFLERLARQQNEAPGLIVRMRFDQRAL